MGAFRHGLCKNVRVNCHVNINCWYGAYIVLSKIAFEGLYFFCVMN